MGSTRIILAGDGLVTQIEGASPTAADLMEVLEIARSLAASPELQPLLERVEASVLRVLDCDRAGVFVLVGSTNELAGRVVTGERGLRFPADRGIAGSVLRDGVAIRLDDAHLDPRFNPEVDRRTGYRTRSLLTVPVRDWADRPIGVLTALNKRGGTFGPRDEALAAALARNRDLPARALIAAIHDELLAFASGTPPARRLDRRDPQTIVKATDLSGENLSRKGKPKVS